MIIMMIMIMMALMIAAAQARSPTRYGGRNRRHTGRPEARIGFLGPGPGFAKRLLNGMVVTPATAGGPDPPARGLWLGAACQCSTHCDRRRLDATVWDY